MNTFSIYKYYLLLVIICSCNSNTENIQLLLELPENSEHVFTYETETSGSLISLKLFKEIKFKVTAIRNNIYYLSADLLKVTSETIINGDSESYTSAMDETKMTASELKIHSQYKPMLESTYSISVDKYGNVVKAFTDKKGLPAPEGFFDFKLFQIIFPYKKISTKSRWESQRLNPILPKPILVKYELKHIDENKLYISANHVIPSMQELLNSNTLYGDYIIDKANGMLIESKLKMNLQTGGSVLNTFTRKQ